MFNFKEELLKISEPQIDVSLIETKEDISTTLEAFNKVVTKLLKKQGAVSMQVEEIYSILEEDEKLNKIEILENKNEKMVTTLITAADLIEDFYIYYKEHPDEVMAVQSELMWNTLCKEMAVVGLQRISDENTPFNVQLNTIEGVLQDSSLPEGFIVKVLKSGYQYHGRLYRKSTVIVNKKGDKE